MVLKNVSGNREWIEIHNENPDCVRMLRPSLVSLLGFDRYRNPSIAGTGFIIGSNENGGIVLTAKHVLEGISSIQKPESKHVLSSPFVPRNKMNKDLLSASSLNFMWQGAGNVLSMNAAHASFNETTDIASCMVVAQDVDMGKFKANIIPLDLRVPSVGDEVFMVSCANLDVMEAVSPTSASDHSGQVINMTRSVNIRVGYVTGVYEEGLRGRKEPCFTTSIPADPGMSGGFVALYEPPNKTIGVCGVISADFSTEEARKDFLVAGESVISCAWSSLGLSVPRVLSSDEPGADKLIYDMIKEGGLTTVSGDIERFELVNSENGDITIKRRK